jgi:hypothetical protein
MRPTDEQQAVIDAVRKGDNVVVQAAAGAGKTSTLRGRLSRRNRRMVHCGSCWTQRSGSTTRTSEPKFRPHGKSTWELNRRRKSATIELNRVAPDLILMITTPLRITFPV